MQPPDHPTRFGARWTRFEPFITRLAPALPDEGVSLHLIANAKAAEGMGLDDVVGMLEVLARRGTIRYATDGRVYRPGTRTRVKPPESPAETTARSACRYVAGIMEAMEAEADPRRGDVEHLEASERREQMCRALIRLVATAPAPLDEVRRYFWRVFKGPAMRAVAILEPALAADSTATQIDTSPKAVRMTPKRAPRGLSLAERIVRLAESAGLRGVSRQAIRSSNRAHPVAEIDATIAALVTAGTLALREDPKTGARRLLTPENAETWPTAPGD